MKRTLTILAVALLAAVSFGAGAATKAPIKFPWVPKAQSKKLNAPSGKTLLEWKCLAAAVKAKAVPFKAYFDMVGFEATPEGDRLRVLVAIVPKKGVVLTKANLPGRLNDVAYFYVRDYIRQRVCAMAEDFRALEIRIFMNGKLVAVRNAAGFKMLVAP